MSSSCLSSPRFLHQRPFLPRLIMLSDRERFLRESRFTIGNVRLILGFNDFTETNNNINAIEILMNWIFTNYDISVAASKYLLKISEIMITSNLKKKKNTSCITLFVIMYIYYFIYVYYFNYVYYFIIIQLIHSEKCNDSKDIYLLASSCI